MRHKPYYTSEELTAAVDRIERLCKLRDNAERNYRLTQDEPARAAYKASYERLQANVKTSEILYGKMVEKLNSVK